MAWARRTKARAQEQEGEPAFRPVASEERNALLSPHVPEGGEPIVVPDDEDQQEQATQHILSALGRFHRQVTKAKVGAAQELWSDECMGELVLAAEIAVQQGWRDTVQVLSETGRILQTYEDAGRAKECIQFLSEVYEILSLMVGDLIVGEVRPAVMDKWQACYSRALKDLQAAGLTLIEDEEEEYEDEEAQAAAEAGERPLNTVPFELPPLDDFEDEGDETQTDAPTLDNLSPIPSSAAGPAEPIDPALLAQEQARERSDVAEDEGPGEADIPEMPTEAAGEAAPDIEPAGGAPDTAEGEPTEQAESVEAPPEEEPVHAKSQGEDPEVLAILDSFSEGLAKIEDGGDRDLTTVYAAMRDGVGFLNQWAERAEHDEAQRICRAMGRLCDLVADGDARPNEKFFELGYGFCEAFVDAKKDEAIPSVSVWLEECEGLRRKWLETPEASAEETPEDARAAEDAVEETGGDDAPVIPPEDAEETIAAVAEAVEEPAKTVDDGTPESLLRIAQEAVADGRAAEAKLYAMQAAAAFAKREEEQAEQRLSDIERRINEGSAQIETARGELHAAEEEVSAAEESTKSGEGAIAECEGSTQEARGQLESIDAEIADLDERIRELQAQRDAAAQRREEADSEVARKNDEEAQARADLEQRRSEEESARVRLEEARQRVKNFERKRGELEGEMERARDRLERHQNSLADIQQTIAQLRSAHPEELGDAEDLLF